MKKNNDGPIIRSRSRGVQRYVAILKAKSFQQA
jgi:hypothetical protein